MGELDWHTSRRGEYQLMGKRGHPEKAVLTEAHPKSDRKWGTYGLGTKGRSKSRGELNKTLEDSFFFF